MIDIKKYQKIEAVQELIDDYNLIIANLQADIDLKTIRIQYAEERLKLLKPANHRLFGYMRIMRFKETQHLSEMKKFTYLHYQDGLHQKLNDLKNVKK